MKIRTTTKTTFSSVEKTVDKGTEVEIIDIFLMERCSSGIAVNVILPQEETTMTIDIGLVLSERGHSRLPEIISKMKMMLIREEPVESFLENHLLSTEYGI